MRAEFVISAVKNEHVDQELTKSVTCLFLSGVFGGRGGREVEQGVFIFFSSSTLS